MMKDNNKYVFTSNGDPIHLNEKMTKHERNIRHRKFPPFDPSGVNLLDWTTHQDPAIDVGLAQSKSVSPHDRAIEYQ